jgi:hypothetical protein
VVHLPVASADYIGGNVINDCPQTLPHIHAELLLVCRMDCTIRIVLYPLVLVVNFDDAM